MRAQLVTALLVVSVSAPAEVFADSITITFLGRAALAVATDAVGDGASQLDLNRDALSATASVSRGPDNSNASAMLLSTVANDAHRFSGAGSAVAAGTNSDHPLTSIDAHGSSALTAILRIDSPVTFDFAGLFSGTEPMASSIFGRWAASLAVESPFQTPPPVFAFERYDTQTLHETGTLRPGLYTFRVKGEASSSFFGLGSAASRTNFDFDLNFTDVATPEPASFLLLGTGLLGLARRRPALKAPFRRTADVSGCGWWSGRAM